MIRIGTGILLLIPAVLSALTLEQLKGDLAAKNARIRTMEADFTLRNSGMGDTNVQDGRSAYSAENGTVLEYFKPVKMKMELRPNGEILVNGEKKRNLSSPVQNGDPYFLDFLGRFRLKAGAETESNLIILGYDSASRLTSKKLVEFRYRKTDGVFDRVEYLGTGKDYPYEMEISYTNIGGLPVMEAITTRLAAFSVTVSSEFRYKNLRVELR